MLNMIYTVREGKIEKHEVVRKTNTGWTVKCSYGTKLIKRRDVGLYIFPRDTYTAENLEAAKKIAIETQQHYECKIRDSESCLMNLHLL